jgi:hypothetical protein
MANTTHAVAEPTVSAQTPIAVGIVGVVLPVLPGALLAWAPSRARRDAAGCPVCRHRRGA